MLYIICGYLISDNYMLYINIMSQHNAIANVIFVEKVFKGLLMLINKEKAEVCTSAFWNKICYFIKILW